MQVGQPLLINLACTGVIPTRSMSPHVPLTHDEIVADVARCLALGVQMVHLHARDAQGIQTADPERYGRMIEAIRALPQGRSVILCVTTSGRCDPGFESRAQVLDLNGIAKPDMASLTLSSLNFVSGASVNAPDTIRRLAQKMLERGIKPELEVFDVGMAHFSKVLLKEGLLQAPLYVNVLLGNITGAQPDLLQLAAILAALPPDCMVSIGGLGQHQLASNALGLLVADGVRIGLEDNLWLDQGRTQLASNVALVERVQAHAKLLGRCMMAPAAVRARLFP